MLGGQGFATELANRDFRATLARWYVARSVVPLAPAQ